MAMGGRSGRGPHYTIRAALYYYDLGPPRAAKLETGIGAREDPTGNKGTHHRHCHAFRTVPSCTLRVSYAVARTVHTSCIRRPHQPENPMSASSGILLSCLYLPLRAYYYHTSATCLRCGLSLFLYNNSLLKIRLPLHAPTAYTDVRVLPGV